MQPTVNNEGNPSDRKSLQEILRRAHEVDVLPWLREASLSDIEAFIANTSPRVAVHQHAINERDRRYAAMARKIHWTVIPGFIIGFLAMVFAAISAWPVLGLWFR
jgi:hypothetical protein